MKRKKKNHLSSTKNFNSANTIFFSLSFCLSLSVPLSLCPSLFNCLSVCLSHSLSFSLSSSVSILLSSLRWHTITGTQLSQFSVTSPALSLSLNSSNAAGSVSVQPYRNTFLMCASRSLRLKGRDVSWKMLWRARNPCFKQPIKRPDGYWRQNENVNENEKWERNDAEGERKKR